MMERDVSDVAPRVAARRVDKALRLLAANQAGELVKSRIARDAGVSESSVATYLDVLETMYLTAALRPWTPNLTSRESSKPKVYVTDPGLGLRVSRIGPEKLMPLTSAHFGQAMEAFVATELLKQRTWSTQQFELFHFRTRDGLEVDIVLELADGSVIGVEVKSGATLKAEHFTGLRTLRDKLGDRFVAGVVLNTASAGIAFGDRLMGLPVSSLWEL